MGKPSAPTPPDPVATARAQADSNVNTATSNAWLNNTNQYGPTGQIEYQQIGTNKIDGRDIPRFSQTTSLTPAQQQLFNAQQGVSQKAYDLAGNYADRIGAATARPFSYSGMPAAPVYDEAFRAQQRDAIIARNQPNMDRDREAMRTQAINQGIAPGSEAWMRLQDDSNRGINDFRLAADTQAGGEAARAYGLAGDSRDRAIREEQALRAQPINEIAALLGTGSGVQQPQFGATNQYNVAGTDVAGIYADNYRSQVQAYQAQQQANSAMIGGVTGLLGAGLGGWAGGGFGALGGLAKKSNSY